MPSVFELHVSGVFLEQFPGDLCVVDLEFNELRPEAALDAVADPNFPADILVVGLSDYRKVEISVASKRFCDGFRAEEMERAFHVSPGDFTVGKVHDFEKLSTNKVFEDRGLDVVDLSFKEFGDDCSIVRAKGEDISLDEIIYLRYRFAIPILYYNSANGKEVVVFENECGNKEDLIKVVDYVKSVYIKKITSQQGIYDYAITILVTPRI